MSLQGLTIGVPKEVMQGERRVAAIPATVKKMHDAAIVTDFHETGFPADGNEPARSFMVDFAACWRA